jgi:glutamine amidotransferase
MCRLFGFRSVIRSQVHRSLVSADNALQVQSSHHPDGWGVVYYVGGSPHLVRNAASAVSDKLFARVSGVVASETVLAHVRRATQGDHTLVNAHPFQYGRWTFAHNGNLEGFARHRQLLLSMIPPEMRRFILGDTDSEVLFFLLLSHMERRAPIHAPEFDLDLLVDAVRSVVDEITELCGPVETDPAGPSHLTYLTFVITDGRAMVAHQGGKPLFYSTYKHRCPERDTCPSWGEACEALPSAGFVNHFIVSSEPLQGENVWHALEPFEIAAVDSRMRIRLWTGATLMGASI